MTPFKQQEAILDQEAERISASGHDPRDEIIADAALDIGV